MSVDEATSLLSSDLKQDQLNDPDIKLIFDHVSHKTTPNAQDKHSEFTLALLEEYDSLIIKGKNLYRQIRDEYDRTIDQFVLSESHIDTILHNLHDSAFSGHLGQNKTLQRVEERFFFPNMKARINKYVQECEKSRKR